MKRPLAWLGILLSLLSLAAACQWQPDEPADRQAATAPSADETTEIETAMSKLAPDERAVAEAQRICPVSDQPLGSMGTPIKVTAQGRDVYVCCEGCVEELQQNFDKYASKLDDPDSSL